MASASTTLRMEASTERLAGGVEAGGYRWLDEHHSPELIRWASLALGDVCINGLV